MKRLFLLSPARSAGPRAELLQGGRSALAGRLRSEAGAPLGEVFTFLSHLYFRGKLAYARAFALPPEAAALVIVPGAGLLPLDTPITAAQLRAIGGVDVDAANAAFRGPLERDARAVDDGFGPLEEVVLLGSIASGKYVDVLGPLFGERLRFPASFVGRGDMSRGGLLLRAAAAGEELEYAPVLGTARHGKRPPRLPRRVP